MPLGAGDVACWLVKTARAPAELVPGWLPGEERTLTRCLRRSYRLGLMTPGAPCLLWQSGRAAPGVHAVGTLAAPVTDDGPAVALRLTLLAEPLPRADLLADPRTAGAEVLRMPAGSNPSWLSPQQFAAVRELLGTELPPAGLPAGRLTPRVGRT